MKVVDYKKEMGPELSRIWRESKHHAIRFEDPYTEEEYLSFLDNVLNDHYTVKVCIDDQGILGMIVFSDHEINQLYVRKEKYGLGLGKTLLSHALDLMGNKVYLRVFQVNEKAIKFYESFGFKVQEAGYSDEEALEDWLMCLDK